MNHLGGMALIGSSSVFMVGNAAQDTEKGLVSLFGSFRVQPCANNEMGGWLDSVGCGNSNPRIQRCRILVGWTGARRDWGATSRTVPSWTSPYHHPI